ncbi:mitochondrial import inner membrane translocase subunit TIM8 [Nadsonia fulvescens var. elongata DSM 6958]|uniref:Mitochondrial import inner membrane translocase subunit n=1 Tax=Nadsonia fulvescens var. elongata DSM 6958 TaxID=857566 RepID=A0A1E3PM95_9ASCO|nr:mitochondrial import inner membrane translocase subunit TIM8 [Nadsonia fulvescens var. elongata DSM 6958]
MPELDSQALASLDAESRKEIMQWIDSENSKAKVQSSIHNFTDMCWKKCVTKDITSNMLDTTESNCMTNCLQRFLDTNINVVKLIQAAQK